MFSKKILSCVQVYYEKEDKLQLTDHLRSEHQAEDGLDYLMAGCLMNEDERKAIVNVIQDREPHYVGAEQPADTAAAEEEEEHKEADTSDLSISALVPETTLQEVETGEAMEQDGAGREEGECSPPTLEESNKHVVEFPCPECDLSFNLKIRLNRHLKNHAKRREMAGMLKLVKTESLQETPSKTPSKTSSQIGKSMGNRGPPKNYIEPPPGTGYACPGCDKRFKGKTAMERHFEDIHEPGEYPCKGCGRIFSSKNKVSSHYSRNCKGRQRLSI